jgi:hypothetical protein
MWGARKSENPDKLFVWVFVSLNFIAFRFLFAHVLSLEKHFAIKLYGDVLEST